MTTPLDIDALATKIAARLFTNGAGKGAIHADRLEQKVGRPVNRERALGGWCEMAVRDVIADEIRKASR